MDYTISNHSSVFSNTECRVYKHSKWFSFTYISYCLATYQQGDLTKFSQADFFYCYRRKEYVNYVQGVDILHTKLTHLRPVLFIASGVSHLSQVISDNSFQKLCSAAEQLCHMSIPHGSLRTKCKREVIEPKYLL